jgi:hypothetical protein
MSDNKTWNDLVQSIWPNVTAEQAEILLWETTCFPMGTAEDVERQLRENYQRSGGDVDLIVKLVYADIDQHIQENRFWEALTDDYENRK